MKTPEQIAARTLEIYSEKFREEYGARPLYLPIDDAAMLLIAGAIGADRVQREPSQSIAAIRRMPDRPEVVAIDDPVRRHAYLKGYEAAMDAVRLRLPSTKEDA